MNVAPPRNRIILAFTIAPFAASLFFVATNAVVDSRTFHVSELVLYGIFTYAAALTLGLVAYLVRPRKWQTEPYYYVVGGAGIGLITALAMHFGMGILMHGTMFGRCVFAGALSGVCFWLIGVSRRHQ